MMGEFIIEKFYFFFQGIMLYQVIFFGVLYFLSKRREVLYYCLLNFITSIYFFLNAPDTFFDLDPEIVFNSTWYLYLNFAIFLSLTFLYGLFLKEIFIDTFRIKFITNIYNATVIIIPIMYLLFVIFTLLDYSTNVIFYLAHQLNGLFAFPLIYYNIKNKGNIRLIVYGMIVIVICVTMTMLMTIRYNAGCNAYYVDKYPLLYVRIGMLIDIVLYQIFLMRNWNDQEKELATKELSNKLELSNLRNEINRDLHDNIGTTLSKINLQSFMAIQKQNEPSFNAIPALASLQLEVQNLITKVRDIVSYDEQITEVSLVEKITEYASEMCASKNIILLNKMSKSATQHLSVNQCYQIVLIAKEAINNAVKYSESTTLEIEMNTSENKMVLSIKDNGIGFVFKNEYNGQGIKNMRYRAEKIGGDFVIESHLKKGTQIVIKLGVN